MTILMAAIGIGFLIFIHEFGHFLCARLLGVRVHVFSLGFGHRLCGFRLRGTDYRLSLVPFGGYVRVAGDDPTQRSGLRPDDLQSKSVGARMLFFSGGVIMNLLFALVVFPLVFNHGVAFRATTIGAVTLGSPAWEAGIEAGDRVVSFDGQPMYDWTNLVTEVALASDRVVVLELERGDRRFEVDVRPRYDAADGLYQIGVQPAVASDALRIESLDPSSPAFAAGLRDGDTITHVGGSATDGPSAAEALGSVEIGELVELTVVRDGRSHDVSFLPKSVETPRPRIGVTPIGRTVAGIRNDVPVVARSGIQRGDLVARVDGQAFLGTPPASDAPDLAIEVTRDGEVRTLRFPATAAERAAFFENVAFTFSDAHGVVLRPLPDSPAARAGIRTGDLVASIDGRDIAAWQDLVDAVVEAGERPMRFRLHRDGQPLELTIAPTREAVAGLGFVCPLEPLTWIYRVESFGHAVRAGCTASIDMIQQLYVTLRKIFRGDVAAKNLGGIVTISRASYHFAEQGWAVFFYFLAILSINLAVVNVLPIPVLDGGHLLFLLIEKVKGSPVSTQVMTYSQVLGLVFVIALMLFVTYNDILRLL